MSVARGEAGLAEGDIAPQDSSAGQERSDLAEGDSKRSAQVSESERRKPGERKRTKERKEAKRLQRIRLELPIKAEDDELGVAYSNSNSYLVKV